MDTKLFFLLLFIAACTGSRRSYAERLLYGSRRPGHSIGHGGSHSHGRYGGSHSPGRYGGSHIHGGHGGHLLDDVIHEGPSNSIRPPAWDSPIVTTPWRPWRPWRPLSFEYEQQLVQPSKPRGPRDLTEDFNRLQQEKLTRRLDWVTLGLQAAQQYRRRPRTLGNSIFGPVNQLYGGLQNTLTNSLGDTLDPVWSIFQRVPLLQSQFLRPVYNRGGFDSDEPNSEENDSGFAENSSVGINLLSSNENNNDSEEERLPIAEPGSEEDRPPAAEPSSEPDAKVEGGEETKGEVDAVKTVPTDIEREAPQEISPALVSS